MKLNKTEHWEVAARELEIGRLAEEESRLIAQKNMLEVQYQQVSADLASLPSRKAAVILLRDSLVEKIGKRAKAEGTPDSWRLHIDMDEPKNSVLSWGEEPSD